MKRIMWFLSLIAMLSFVLSGCSGSEKTTTNGKSKTLTFWVFNNPPMVDNTKKLIKVYEEKHPNIKIELQVMPNDQYSQKYTVALGTQTGPDVLLLSDRSIPALTDKGVLAPIEPKAFGFDSIDKLKSGWIDGSLEGLTNNNKIYGIPMEFDTFSLFINKKAFEASGLDPEKDAPKTWDQLAETAQKLTIRKDGKLTQAGFAWPMFNGGWDALIMDPMVRQLGGKFIDDYGNKAYFTSKEVKQVFQTWYDMYNTSKTSDIGFGTSQPADPNLSFKDGSVAMWISGPWAIPEIKGDSRVKDDYEVVPLPQFDPSNPVTLLYSWNWTVNKATKYPKESWEFVNYLSKNQENWLDTAGYIQPRKGWLESDTIKNFPYSDVWLSGMEHGSYIMRSKNYAQLTDVLGRSVDAVMKENISIDKALKTAQDEAEKVLGGAK